MRNRDPGKGNRDPGKARRLMRPGEESKTMLIFLSSSQENWLGILDWVPRNTSLLALWLALCIVTSVSLAIPAMFLLKAKSSREQLKFPFNSGLTEFPGGPESPYRIHKL